MRSQLPRQRGTYPGRSIASACGARGCTASPAPSRGGTVADQALDQRQMGGEASRVQIVLLDHGAAGIGADGGRCVAILQCRTDPLRQRVEIEEVDQKTVLGVVDEFPDRR